MKYIVFLTISLRDDRIYLGVHKTENPDKFDGYIGAGCWINSNSSFKYPKTPLQCAVKKYGSKEFKRVVLYVYDNEQEAYNKLDQLLNKDFIKSARTFNTFIDHVNIPIYQFNKEGLLVKKWTNYREAESFYGYSAFKFQSAVNSKVLFLDSYWSTNNKIKLNEFINKTYSNYYYVYSKNGKLLREFNSKLSCAKYLKLDIKELMKYIVSQNLIDNEYFVSTKMCDLFYSKPRTRYKSAEFYVYDSDMNFITKCKGKELMKIIKLHSWNKISKIFEEYHNKYQDFYIYLEPQCTNKGISVYDKYGNFIKKYSNLEDLQKDYDLSKKNIKDLLQGNKYFKDNIIKINK